MYNKCLNWGRASKSERLPADIKYINHPDSVNKAGNKLLTFQALEGNCNIPEFTQDKEVATKWLKTSDVVIRHVLRGHSGEGIEIASKGCEDLPDAPLYVKYVPKKHEYRVHVGFGKAFFVQRKARKKDVDDDAVNWKVRNLDGGFIYAHVDVDVPQHVKEMCESAIITLGLDFGAVDLIYNEKQDAYYILEINTAPGLAGTTLDKYVQMFKENPNV